MYLRHGRIRKNGKTHIHGRLVRPVRKGTRVTQETVAQLGEWDKVGRLEAQALARRITGTCQSWSPDREGISAARAWWERHKGDPEFLPK